MTEALLTTALSKELFSRWRVSCLSFPLQVMLSTFIAQKDILPIIPSYDDMKEVPGYSILGFRAITDVLIIRGGKVNNKV